MYYPTARESKNISLAFKAAKKSVHRCRHGAVVRSGSRISVGFNKTKNHPKFVGPDDFLRCGTHAERNALRMHSNPRNAFVASVRLDRAGKLGMAKPCIRCETELRKAGIRRVIFSNPKSPSGFEVMVL